MRPEEILDAQMELLDRLQHNDLFRRHQAIASAQALGLTAAARYVEAGGEPEAGRAWVEALTASVRGAYAYQVTPDMCMVLDQAAAALDESDTYDHNLAPTGCGIVRFERPLQVLDARGMEMRVHWVIWGPATIRDRAGLAFNYFNDAWTEPDSGFEQYMEWVRANGFSEGRENNRERYELAKKSIGRWSSVHQSAAGDGESLGPAMVDPEPHQQAIILSSGDTVHQATNLNRHMHALFLLLNQTLVQTEDAHLARPYRKRAGRAGIPPRVTVIQLRRTEVPRRQDGESLIEWSHRWIVRGHWAWRNCGPELDGAQEYEKGFRRRIWIAPFVKGPEDAPLIVSDKLYKLER